MTTYSFSSPYYNTPITNGYLDIASIRDLPEEIDDFLFEVTQQYTHRPDLLAYDLYGDANLWWVFSIRNKSVLKDPIYDMLAGQKIYLPKIATLRDVLGL
jgi:hypothetical protein